MVPKDQMYQQMAMMQPPRRNDDLPGKINGNIRNPFPRKLVHSAKGKVQAVIIPFIS